MMAKLLMCKNKAIYNIEAQKVLNQDLLPGCMQVNPTTEGLMSWMKLRYSSGTNTFARQLRGLLFGQGNRLQIDETTHAVSFSDCYWLKDSEDPVAFEEVSPYYGHFWTGDGMYQNEGIPTLYVDGALPKEWTKEGFLHKVGANLDVEIDCIKLCRACGIPVEFGFKVDDGICLENFTNENIMLEKASESGRIPEETYTAADIVKWFGVFGVELLTIDAIVGNGDRHLGNLGWLRDANTGIYLGPAPAYDFDHAMDAKSTEHSDILIQEVVDLCEDYRDRITEILEVAKDFDDYSCDEVREVFQGRAQMMLNIIQSIPIIDDPERDRNEEDPGDDIEC